MRRRDFLVSALCALAGGCQGAAAPGPQAPAAARARAGAGSGSRAAAAEGAGLIRVPELLAVELPRPDMAEIAPDASPISELLAAAAAAAPLKVVHDRMTPLRIGANRVTWTAWEGNPNEGVAKDTRSAWVYVFPFGQTPAGVSGRYNMTSGNHSAKVVRDSTGGVHVAWLDAGRQRPGNRVMYRRGAHDPVSGRVVWETEAVAVNDSSSAAGNSYLALEGSERAIHFAWHGGRTTRYRRLVRDGAQWRFEPIQDTGATGSLHDTGTDIAIRGDDEIHVVTPTGQYSRSVNGGARWKAETVPSSGPAHRKNAALAVDAQGNAHVVFTYNVRNAKHWQSSRPNGGHWQLRYVRRRADGGWEDAQDALGRFPEWGDLGMAKDTLADWADIAIDPRGTIHLAWHGTARTGVYGQDDAFYARRPATGAGAWGDWEAPLLLLPRERASRRTFSFAPSLSWDPRSDTVVATVFYETSDRPREIFDSVAVVLKGGRVVGEPIPLSQMTRLPGRWEDGVSTWFPCAAPRLYHDARGRVWLDVLTSAETPQRNRSLHYAVYQKVDVTDRIARP